MEFDRRRELPVHCPECDEMFPAPKSMLGGYANCPRCRRAVEVTQGYEPLFWVLFGLGCAVGILISVGAFFAGGPVVGCITLAVCALVIAGIVMAS